MAVRTTRDHYVVLGVPRDADRVQVRKAYRALAAALHPDVCDEPDAPERFREVVAAYKVLSDPDSRRRYDRIGMSRRAPFDDLYATRGAPAPRTGERGEDIRVDASVDYLEAARGTTRGLTYDVVAACTVCDATGVGAGGRRLLCGDCGGSGRVREVGSGDRGRMIRFRECPGCRGSGSVVDRPCGTCAGEGRVSEARVTRVTIPPGSSDGDEILLAGEGHAGGHGGPPGDVVVTLCVREAPDSPLVRYLAAAGAACAAILLVVTLLLH